MAGKISRSPSNAEKIATQERPTKILMCGSSLTRLLEKPTSKIKVLVIKAAPTAVKVRFKAASISSSTSSSRRNLLTKWIVSSTATPKQTVNTSTVATRSDWPLNTITAAVINNGKRFGLCRYFFGIAGR